MNLIVQPEENSLTNAQMTFVSPVTTYLIGLYSEGSRRVMLSALNQMAQMLNPNEEDAYETPWWLLRYKHTKPLRALLEDRYEVATANRYLSALRGILQECWRLEMMTYDDYIHAIDFENFKAHKKPVGRLIEDAEIIALIDNCIQDNSTIGFRDCGLLAVLFATGLRRDEVVKLDIEECEFYDTSARLLVHGKGNKLRAVFVAKSAYKCLIYWLQVRPDEPGPLFLPVHKSGQIGTKRLSSQAIYRIVINRARNVGIIDISPHDLRRTFASRALNEVDDIAKVSRIMGHSDINTTGRYDKRPEAQNLQVAELVDLPIGI